MNKSRKGQARRERLREGGSAKADRPSNDGGRARSSAPAAPNRRVGARSRLGIIALILVALGVAGYVWWRQSPGQLVRSADQNVLLVTIDTLRADALGSAGGRAATPNLDALAADGIRFTSAHAHAVVTLPSHTSILTGLYPFQHGVRDNTGYRLRPDVPTLAGLLARSGFATGAFVGAFPLDSRFGLARDFNIYDDHYGETSGIVAFAMPERPASVVVDLAARWIERQQGKWFAWVHVFDPHAPYAPPAPFAARYPGHPYEGEVAYVDSALGRLFELARKQSRPTFIVVTGDHGEALGEHGEQTHGLFAYESTLKVPLIIDDTGHPKPFRRNVSDIPARHVDIVPTILDALSLSAPSTLPGRSLVAAMERGDSSKPTSYFEALSAFLNRGWAPLTGVMVGQDKYIDLPIPELYAVRTDPRETRNLLPGHDEQGRALSARLHAFNASPLDATNRIREDANAVAQLQALGYVSGSAPTKAHYTEKDDPKRLVGIDRSIHEGVDLFQRGKPEQALQVYRKVIEERPSMATGYLHAAFLEWELGRPRNAIGTLEQALRSGASTGELRTQLGIYLAEGGSAQQAVQLLEPAAREPSPDVETLNALGIALSRAGRQQDAMAIFQRALQLAPDDASAWQNIGTVYLEQKNNEAAAKAFGSALALDPKLATALNGLGVAELRRGNRAGAIEAWKRAVAADPRQFDTLFNLGNTLRETGDLADARTYLERFARTAPPAFYGPDIARVNAWLAREDR